MFAATVLAAGASERMGRPKAVLEFAGRTFLQTILDTTADLGISTMVAVGYDSDNILSTHDLRGIQVVVNRELDAGPIGSIRASIRALPGEAVAGLIVWPVDFPRVRADTVRQLIFRFQRDDCAVIVLPEFESQNGHPVIFGREVFGELLVAPDSEGARAVVRKEPTRVSRVAVADSAVVDNVNTPEAYQKLLALGE